MSWLPWTVAAILIATMLTGLVFLMLSAGSLIELGDIEQPDDDDDDDDDDVVFEFSHILPIPPFPVRSIGLFGQHDRYPLTHKSRQFWIEWLDASWELPARERTP